MSLWLGTESCSILAVGSNLQPVQPGFVRSHSPHDNCIQGFE